MLLYQFTRMLDHHHMHMPLIKTTCKHAFLLFFLCTATKKLKNSSTEEEQDLKTAAIFFFLKCTAWHHCKSQISIVNQKL